jgi:hypothetical protein
MHREPDDLTQLRSLKVKAPEHTITRLWRRLNALILGRDLVERQAYSFWIVLDALLRVLVRPRRPARNKARGHKESDTLR